MPPLDQPKAVQIRDLEQTLEWEDSKVSVVLLISWERLRTKEAKCCRSVRSSRKTNLCSSEQRLPLVIVDFFCESEDLSCSYMK